MEIRTTGGVQAQGRKVTGYAAVFNSAADLGEFREVIHPGAFARSLSSGVNVRALYDHQSGAILGTTQARTLQLIEDSHGLRFELDLPDTTVGRDVAELVSWSAGPSPWAATGCVTTRCPSTARPSTPCACSARAT